MKTSRFSDSQIIAVLKQEEAIQPWKPQQNAYVERFNRTVRYDWLGQYLFESIAEVQDYATSWLWLSNHERPNMALGGSPPNSGWPWSLSSTSDSR